MRNFAKRCRAAAVLAILLGQPAVAASEADGPLDSYLKAQAQERQVLAAPESALRDFRAAAWSYEEIVRRFPTSGYADNALWQAAGLRTTAYQRFGDELDLRNAVRLLQWLVSEYPSSSLVPKAAAAANALLGAGPAPAQPRPAQVLSRAPEPASLATIQAIQRTVLPELVRVTLELDIEVPFHQERLDGPARVFLDFSRTRTVSSLRDVTLRYGDEVVRAIRVGRHPNNTTRVVLDLDGIGQYSVYTLYSPYRIVIDCERAKVPLSAAATSPSPGPLPASSAPDARVTSPSAAPPQTVETPVPPQQKPQAAAVAASGPADQSPALPAANSGGGFSLARQLGLGVSRIVIDPGHGGHDPGAMAFDVSEAALALDIALRLEALLLKRPGIEVLLTRRTDEYVALEQRTAIANRESADLFLSIHVNASANGSARGVETYFLNFALTPEAELVAARENAASGRTMNSLPDIVKAIALNNKIDESKDFATTMQRALVQRLRASNAGVKDLGVKQAPFVVLVRAAMPAVLAEVSFITNRQEAGLLKSDAYRQRMAEALLNGILQYQEALKKVRQVARQ
jgi:N-acetylmuramoyl-L-alanine amidase